MELIRIDNLKIEINNYLTIRRFCETTHNSRYKKRETNRKS